MCVQQDEKVCANDSRSLQRPEDATGSPRDKVTDGCEPYTWMLGPKLWPTARVGIPQSFTHLSNPEDKLYSQGTITAYFDLSGDSLKRCLEMCVFIFPNMGQVQGSGGGHAFCICHNKCRQKFS